MDKIQDILSVLQQVTTNTLTSESPVANQPPHIHIPLRLHQMTALEEMRKKELSLQKGLVLQENGKQQTLYTNYAILGDNVGVGKTLMALGHISQMLSFEKEQEQLIKVPLHKKSNNHCFSIEDIENVREELFSTLVIVPHTIYLQWMNSIQEYTSLNANFLKTQRDLDKPNFLEHLRTSHLTLVSNNLFVHLMRHLKHLHTTGVLRSEPTWRRIFFDEIDTIRIPQTCTFPNAYMIWCISATYNNLLFLDQQYNGYYIRRNPEILENISPDIISMLQDNLNNNPRISFYTIQSKGFFSSLFTHYHPLRGHLVIQNHKHFLHESITLPPLYQHTITCQIPMAHLFISSIVNSQVQAALHAGDIETTLELLGITTHTSISLVEAVTASKKKEIERLQRLLTFQQQENQYESSEINLTNLQNRIENLQLQLQSFEEKIQEASRDSCSICYEKNNSPIITPCCTKTFCTQCILEWITRIPNCPLCRASIHPNNLVALSTSNIPREPQSRVPKKIEALVKIIEENPEGQFLVFSRYENTFENIQKKIGDLLAVEHVQGSMYSIQKALQNFSEKKVRLLFLSSNTAAAGLHIPTATHLILFHRMRPDEEKQILGRAYRLGRTEPLHFIHLLHEHE